MTLIFRKKCNAYIYDTRKSGLSKAASRQNKGNLHPCTPIDGHLFSIVETIMLAFTLRHLQLHEKYMDGICSLSTTKVDKNYK